MVKLIDDRTEGGRETNITATEEHKSDSDTLQTVMRIRRTDEHEEEKVTFTFTFRAFSSRCVQSDLQSVHLSQERNHNITVNAAK